MKSTRSSTRTPGQVVAVLLLTGVTLVAARCLTGTAVGTQPTAAPPTAPAQTAPATGAVVEAGTTGSTGPTTGTRAITDTVQMADGHLPGSATVFDHYPGVDNLDPVLLSHLRQAAQAAAPDQVTFVVNSGWRTPAYQQQLFDDAVRQYGSAGQAAQWVAPPDKSLHVSGQAVDLGWTASDWLAHHGAAYGLCQIYVNEPWHYELRPQASSTRCPLMYADATADPRLR